MKRKSAMYLEKQENEKPKNENCGLPKNARSYLPIDCENSFLEAAENEDWEVLKWLTIQNGVKLDQDVIRIVAESKNLEMLQYLVTECGMILDEDSLIAATENEDFEMLKWMVEDQGIELYIDKMEVRLGEKPNLEMIKWAYIKNPSAQINYTDVVSLKAQSYIQRLEYIAQTVNELVSLSIAPSSPLALETMEELDFLLEVFQEQLQKNGLPGNYNFESYKVFLGALCSDVLPENILNKIVKVLDKIEKKSLIEETAPEMNLKLDSLDKDQSDSAVGMHLAGDADINTFFHE